jgi:enamine deaminase RidA (YjgF/YER057c/UK114 family)
MEKPWRLPIPHTHDRAGSAGCLSFVGGAGDFDDTGRIRHPGDLDAQIVGAVANLAEALATELCSLEDVVRLKAFYTADRDDWDVIAALAPRFATDPLNTVEIWGVAQG